MSKDSLEVMARLMDSPIEVRDIVDKFLLITYDIPHTPEGDVARRVFLNEAKMIGATRHTDSTYIMPWTKHAEILALRLGRAGEVCVWTSNTTDEVKAEEITQNYDRDLKPQIESITERVDKIAWHFEKGHSKTAFKMVEKTERMIDNMEQAIVRRGSAQLYVLLGLVKERFQVVARTAWA